MYILKRKTDILQINSSNTIGTYLKCLNIDEKKKTKDDCENIN